MRRLSNGLTVSGSGVDFPLESGYHHTERTAARAANWHKDVRQQTTG
ncbi:hypothetical protein ACFL5M_06050 [Candidatus Neomarinimicrobiota bacterium]